MLASTQGEQHGLGLTVQTETARPVSENIYKTVQVDLHSYLPINYRVAAVTPVVSYSSKASSNNKPNNRNGLPTTCSISFAQVTLCN